MPFIRPIFFKNNSQCGPSCLPNNFSFVANFNLSLPIFSADDVVVVVVEDDDADDVCNKDDNGGVDGDLCNLSNENLLPVQDSTVFNSPLCSCNDLGVVCNELTANNCNAVGRTINAGDGGPNDFDCAL